jgi:hypothetical protein
MSHARELAMKDYARAVADYEKAVQLAGKAPYASTYCTALALLRAGCPDGTIRDGGKALEAAPQAHALAKGPAEMAALAAAHAELAGSRQGLRPGAPADPYVPN